VLQYKFINGYLLSQNRHLSILDGAAVSNDVGPEPQQVFNDNLILRRGIEVIEVNDIDEFV